MSDNIYYQTLDEGAAIKNLISKVNRFLEEHTITDEFGQKIEPWDTVDKYMPLVLILLGISFVCVLFIIVFLVVIG